MIMSSSQDNTEDRIDRICDSVKAWLDNEDGMRENSVERTVTEGLFTRYDLEHMLDQIARTVTRDTLASWVNRVLGEREISDQEFDVFSGSDSDPVGNSESIPQNVLCLHAGNLPMVGLQDVIATLLSGAAYYGKLSGKDPWLLDGLLRVLRNRLPDQLGGWAVRLEDLDAVMAGKVLFAGSQASVDGIVRRVRELNVAAPEARFLPRTARLSMAWLREEDFRPDSVPLGKLSKRLIEAMLRYEGRGCRSVAVVIASRNLSEFAGWLTDTAEVFVRSNPPSPNHKQGANYWKSYLKSTGRDVYDLGGQIITDDADLMGRQDVICWVKGGVKDVERLARRFGPQLQSVYVNADPAVAGTGGLIQPEPYQLAASDGIRLEPLRCAQTPPIDWQPDGVDVLSWLLK